MEENRAVQIYEDEKLASPPCLSPLLREPSIFMAARWRFRDTVGVSETMLRRIVNAVEHAEMARKSAAPQFSGFSVGAALDLGADRLVGGANFEYGAGYKKAESRAVHAEVVAIGNALMRYGEPLEVEIVAVSADSETPVCCGNCIDSLLRFSRPDTLVVALGKDQNATILRMNEVFPTQPKEIEVSSLDDEEARLLKAAQRIKGRSIQQFSEQLIGAEGAAVLTDNSEIYEGVRIDSTAFHPQSALESALGHASLRGDPIIKAIALSSKTGFINGNDRQKICERAHALQRLNMLKVLSFAENGSKLYSYTPNALLPFCFAEKNLTRSQPAPASFPPR